MVSSGAESIKLNMGVYFMICIRNLTISERARVFLDKTVLHIPKEILTEQLQIGKKPLFNSRHMAPSLRQYISVPMSHDDKEIRK